MVPRNSQTIFKNSMYYKVIRQKTDVLVISQITPIAGKQTRNSLNVVFSWPLNSVETRQSYLKMADGICNLLNALKLRFNDTVGEVIDIEDDPDIQKLFENAKPIDEVIASANNSKKGDKIGN